MVHSTCTLSIVWHEACVLALSYWHGARKGVHSVYYIMLSVMLQAGVRVCPSIAGHIAYCPST